VVAGHKDKAREDGAGTIEETRRYLDEATRLLAAAPTRQEFFFQLVERYPERINPYTTWLSALRLLRLRRAVLRVNTKTGEDR